MVMMQRWWKPGLFVLALIGLGVWTWDLAAVRGTFVPFRSAAEAGGTAVVLGEPGHRIVGRVSVAGTPVASAPLVVLLHGDAPYNHPGYQYAVAAELADAAPGTRVVALMRPGYADAYGARSDGDRGFASGENYTRAVTEDLAAAIRAAQRQWDAPAVLLIGHSGGAAVAANLAALHPGLVQQAFLVACPCDVPSFRRHMARRHWSPLWLLPARSLSPMQTLERMDVRTKLTAISGVQDPVTLPELAQNYVTSAQARGIEASMLTLPGKGHEILDDPAVIAQVVQAIRDGR